MPGDRERRIWTPENWQKMVEAEPKLFLIQGDVYEVEKLVAVKIVKGQKLYRVRWRGYGRESDTLEPEENLLSCKDMIQDLERKIRDRHERRRHKKQIPFKMQTPFTKELRSSVIQHSPIHMDHNSSDITTWQATEVHPYGHHSKDTFWRDFDEGKISVSGTVYDKDMYSKVKERAERAARPIEAGKITEAPVHKDTLSMVQPPLCPKVLLKRKPVATNSESMNCDNIAYKSTFKVKPMGIQIKKRKKYDVLRDYRRRKSRIHRKRNLDENGQRKLFRIPDKATDGGSKILQELLINDEMKSSGGDPVSIKEMKPPKDPNFCDDQGKEGRKNHPLMCRISMQNNTVALYSSYKQSSKKDHNGKTVHKSSGLDSSVRKVFTSLVDAVVNDQLEKVERLCNSSYVVNCTREDGTTALMIAAALGRYYVTRILLKANAHIDKQDKVGETALMMACKKGHLRIAKLLLEHGANFALTNAEGINVLRILNIYASQPEIHTILIEHIVRVVSQFESGARCQVRHIAQIKYALFPIQCFSLNEGPKYSIHFHHHVKLESPEKNGNQNLLFIARASIKASSVHCQFDADSLVQNICINGVKQDLFQNISSVYKVTGLQNGSNKVTITTAHHPESEVKLIVCSYKVHRSLSFFPTQKLKGE
ncbi:hypothetical protein JTE90_011408 [Oedothorax gibbosus]|uniref:Chromo domain-containing protein n=1 Tax=Oedothorax gibbosus TaxID=931172 RepID=A0AAV6U5J1_9ARAC|nr:hypothetical protein JTE90_011408 [Oedothorax gibbosus]